MNLIYFIFLLLPPSWDFTGEISGATAIYDIIEANDGSLICGGSASSGPYRLWRSTDNGNNWQGVGPATSYAFRCLLKTSSGILFAGRDDGAIYKSNDNGINWTYITDLGLAVLTLFESSTGRLFAGTQTDNAEIYYSDDGNTWTPVDLPGNLDVYCFAQFGTGRIVCGTNSANVYVSDNNGLSWNIGGTLSGANVCYTLKLYGNNLYAGTNNNNGELYLSTDFANSFINLGDNLAYSSSVYDIFFRGDTMYVGTGYYGEVAKSLDFGQSFDYTRNADGAEYVYEIIEKSGKLYIATGNTYGDIFYSANLVPDYITSDLQGATSVLTLEFYGDSLYAGTNNNSGELYLSTDFANSFTNLGNNMPTANAVYDLLFVNYYMFAGTGSNGDVLMSEDFGNSWINTGDLTGATYAYSLIYKLNSPYQNRLYCGTGNYGDVFRSTEFLGEGEEPPKPVTPDHPKILEFFAPPTFFKDEIPIRFSHPSNKPLKIELYNTTGEKVYENLFPFTHSFILKDKHLEKLGKGVFFLRVYFENKIKTFRLIKK